MFFSLKKVVIFDPHLSPKAGQNGSNGRQKNDQKGYLKRDFKKDAEKEVKWSQNGAKIAQKSIEN